MAHLRRRPGHCRRPAPASPAKQGEDRRGDHVVSGVAELTLVDDARVTEADVLVVVVHIAPPNTRW